jgi:hypothetical protein
MKVIFLDIDGVLNSDATENPRRLPYHTDPALVARLHRLLARTGAKVVLTSTWRYDPAGLFSAKHQGIPVFDVTPDHPGQSRHEEIAAWLRGRPDVERFLVIDDEDDGLDSLPLFQPLRSTGLTDEMVEAAAAYLEGATQTDGRRSKLVRLVQNVSATLRGHKG